MCFKRFDIVEVYWCIYANFQGNPICNVGFVGAAFSDRLNEASDLLNHQRPRSGNLLKESGPSMSAVRLLCCKLELLMLASDGVFVCARQLG